jgi:phage baseplate assembly protein W
MTRPTSIKSNKIIYSDIANLFAPNPVNGNIQRVTNENSVKQSLKNIILTNSGERPYKQDLGGNLRRLLFEILDLQTIAILKSNIINTIEQYESRVNVIALDILSSAETISRDVVLNYPITGQLDYDDENTIVVNLKYNIINIPNEQSINISVERTR